MGILPIFYVFVSFPISMLFNGICGIFSFFHQFSISFSGIFFSSIFHLIQWESLHLFGQFSMLFNKNFMFFYHFFPIFHVMQWSNGVPKSNWARVPLCFTGHCPLQSCCAANHHLQSPIYRAGQRVSLTPYCPWTTGWWQSTTFHLVQWPSPFYGSFLSSSLPSFSCPSLPFLRMSRVFKSHAARLYTPLCPAVSPLIRPSVGLSVCWSINPPGTLFGFCGLCPHSSCPSDQVTPNTAPVHPHATGVAVYPALFSHIVTLNFQCANCILHSSTSPLMPTV